MRASNSGTDPTERPAFRGIPEVVDRVFAGGQGFTVRCTPHRRTVMVRSEDGATLFVKLRDGRLADARAEWHWLHVLPMLGLGVPQPVAFERRGSRSCLCTAAAPGRALDAQIVEALRAGGGDAVVAFACGAVAPLVRRLHDQGLVFRDLYWNHLFARSLAPSEEVVFVDVERVFRPRLFLWRWGVKDLAGLASSYPGTLSPRAALRFLWAYLDDHARDRRLRRKLFRAARRKAERIRRHVPRYG